MNFILEGHLCLINKKGEVERINFETFKRLNLSSIIVITAETKTIMLRNKEKYNLQMTEEFFENFQQKEVDYALNLGQNLNIPVKILKENEFDILKIKEYLYGV